MLGFNAFRELEQIRNELDQVFGRRHTANGESWPLSFLPGIAARRYPKINLSEDQDNIYVEALAPGIDPKNFNVSVSGNMLTLSGEKTSVPDDVKPDAFHRSERATGRFVRTIELPAQVNSNQVEAEYKNGILLVTMAKAEEAKPKSIEVKVS